jgi:hypothetical protein
MASRGRGRKRPLAALKIKGIERDDKTGKDIKTLALEAKMKIEKPPELFPEFAVPRPSPISARDQALVDRNHQFRDHFRYSGYYQTRRKRPRGLVRYTDKYTRTEGARDVFDEIPPPSLKVFPKELLPTDGDEKRFTVPIDTALPYVNPEDLLAQAEADAMATGNHTPIDGSHLEQLKAKEEKDGDGDEEKGETKSDDNAASKKKSPAKGKKKGKEIDEETMEDADHDPEEDDDDYSKSYADDGDDNEVNDAEDNEEGGTYD